MTVTGHDDAPAGPATPTDDDLRDRWDEAQVEFVDDPRRAVERADALVGDLVDEIVRSLAAERERLAEAWRDDAEASTEALRLAFQRYRAAFQRLARTRPG